MPGVDRRVMLKAPRTFTSKMRSHSAPVTSWKLVGEVTPALLTNAPIGGADASRVSSAVATEPSSVTSHASPNALVP